MDQKISITYVKFYGDFTDVCRIVIACAEMEIQIVNMKIFVILGQF